MKNIRILFLNQAPNKPNYDVASIEAQLNSYASPGTKVEIGFPDELMAYEIRYGLEGITTIGEGDTLRMTDAPVAWGRWLG